MVEAPLIPKDLDRLGQPGTRNVVLAGAAPISNQQPAARNVEKDPFPHCREWRTAI